MSMTGKTHKEVIEFLQSLGAVFVSDLKKQIRIEVRRAA